ncbi:MAG: hypothetical protein WBR29_03080 [Gammaproteobacteria bacterium]
MLGRPVLTQAQLNQYVPQLTAQDIIWAPLYDSANYIGTAGQLVLNFFSTQVGQGTTTAPGATGTKTFQDTNMQAGGQLTAGNAFYHTGQEILFFPGENPESISGASINGNFVNDVYTFSKNGLLTYTIGSNRQYMVDGPLGVFPPATRLAVATALAGFTVTATTLNILSSSYGVMSGEIYTIIPIYLTANLGFQQVLTWTAAQALPSTNNARLFLRMRGYLNRNAQ